jgi:NADPH:quinone reductase-like Zn-dependent oxidoreductase
MKAIESKDYGTAKVFRLKDVVKPIPKSDEVLIRNYAATVTAADIMMRRGKPYIGRLYTGLQKPKRTILGYEFAGEVVEIGTSVTIFKVGDRVFGGTTALGGYAEFICVNEKEVLTTMPDNISYEEAAPVNGSAVTVMNFLKGQAKISKGQTVLINGASGALGTYAIQIAKHFGAIVTGVCGPSNLEMVKSLGAEFIIDYTKEDFIKNGKQYDIIFDTVAKRTYNDCKSSLTSTGIFLSSGLTFSLLMQSISTSIFGKKKAKVSATGMLPVKVRLDYFLELKELLKSGKIKTVLDKHYSFAKMEDAHAYVEKGHKKGNIVITI